MHKYYTYIPCLPLINGTWSDSFSSCLLFSRCLDFTKRGTGRSRGNADNGYYFWSWTLHAQLCTKAWSIRMEVWMDNKLLFMWFFFLVLNLLRRPTSFRKCYIVFYIHSHAQKVANGSQHFFEGNLSIVLAKKKLVTGTRRLSRGDIISEIAHCEAGQG